MLKKAISLVMVSLLLITQGGCDMANIKTLYGSDKLREAYPKVNENFNAVNGEVNDLRGRVNNIITTPIDGQAAAQELTDARGEHSTLGERLDEFDSHMAETVQETDLTVTVGTSGDFLTINQALKFLSNKNILYKLHGTRVEIKLLSGFNMEEQVLVDGINLGYITITSEDPEVLVNIHSLSQNFPSLHEPDDNYQVYPAFGGRNNAVLPTIGTVFRMTGSDSQNGGKNMFVVMDNSEIVIKPGCGSVDAGDNALYLINGGRALAFGAILKNSRGAGVRVFRGSFASIRKADVSGSLSQGVYLGSSSIVEALEADFSGSGSHGIWAYANGEINARGANLDNCGGNGVYAIQNAKVEVGRATIANAGGYGIMAETKADVGAAKVSISNSALDAIRANHFGTIDLEGATIEGSQRRGIYATNHSSINAANIKIKNCVQHGIYTESSSKVNASNSEILNNGENGLYATLGSEIIANNSLVNGNVGYGVYANRGSKIDVGQSDCRDNLHEAGLDIVCRRGSIINAVDSQGVLSKPTEKLNVLDVNGVIFK